MANLSIKLDLLKISEAFITNIKGRTETRRCVCIPIDNPGLFLGQKGCYLNLVGIELRESKYGNSHAVKVELDKETRNLLSDEEQRQIPFIGDIHPIEPQQMEVTAQDEPENPEDCPF